MPVQYYPNILVLLCKPAFTKVRSRFFLSILFSPNHFVSRPFLPPAGAPVINFNHQSFPLSGSEFIPERELGQNGEYVSTPHTGIWSRRFLFMRPTILDAIWTLFQCTFEDLRSVSLLSELQSWRSTVRDPGPFCEFNFLKLSGTTFEYFFTLPHFLYVTNGALHRIPGTLTDV